MTETKELCVRGALSGSTLKLIACIAMFIDHFGLVMFPKVMIYRIIGRLAFPIFAYFIAEGCKYTRNKLKHFLLIFSVGVIYFLFYLFAYGEVYPSIFLTFSVSILNVYLIDAMKKYALPQKSKIRSDTLENSVITDKENNSEKSSDSILDVQPRVKPLRVLLASLAVASALAVSYIPFSFVVFDYGYIGMLAPVLISLVDFSKVKVPSRVEFIDSKATRLMLLSCICIALAIKNQAMKTELFGYTLTIQVFNLFSLPLLALYNGKVGARKLKYFFYAFYPAHLGVIMAIKFVFDALLK